MSRRSRTCMLLGTAWVPFACFGLALAGCGNIYANPYPPIAPPPATASSAPASPQQATVVPVMTKEGLRHHAEDVLRQAESARQQAKDALALDGSPEAQGVYNEVAGWSPTRRQACLDHAKTLEAKSRTGSRAGVAAFLTKPLAQIIFAHSHGVTVGDADAMTILQVESDVALAETAAQEASAEAQKVADAGAERRKKMDAEIVGVDAATTTCAADPANCKTRCEKSEAMMCFVYGLQLASAKTPKLADARNYLQRGCDAGFLHSCDSVADIDQRLQRIAVRIDDLWTAVVEAGDDLSQKRHAATVLAQLANRPSLQRDLQQLRVVNAAAVTERYCPAVKGCRRRA